MHRLTVEETYPGYARWAATSQSSTFLEGIQPLPAWIGFIGSLLIVFIFTTATWWSTPFTLQKFAAAYGSVSAVLFPDITNYAFYPGTNSHSRSFSPSS